MRRTAAAVALTVVGMWFILSFKSSPLSHVAARVDTPAVTAPADMTPPTSAATPGSQPPAGPPPPGGASTTTVPVPAAIGVHRTVTGDVVPNRYGDVQVAVVLDGTKIVDIQALKLPSDRSRSREISDQAAPLLHDEVLQAQNAQIDTIGGATYTSDGYARSLQSALDKAAHA